MIIDCISDLHGHYPKLEGGDLLIVAGDWTKSDKPDQVIEFALWVSKQKYKKKIVIAGNHDNMIQTTPGILLGLPDFCITYLCDSGTEFEGLRIWGSPWTLSFEGINPHCKAFTVETEKELCKKWDKIPKDIDILITHGPPFGILDEVCIYQDFMNEASILANVGSVSLGSRVLGRFPNLKIHVFGHIHEHGGKVFETTLAKFINASHVNECYDPVNDPIRIIL